MKAVKDCEWEVEILRDIGRHWWFARTTDDCGSNLKIGDTRFDTPQKAKNHWRKYAELNGIKNWRWV